MRCFVFVLPTSVITKTCEFCGSNFKNGPKFLVVQFFIYKKAQPHERERFPQLLTSREAMFWDNFEIQTHQFISTNLRNACYQLYRPGERKEYLANQQNDFLYTKAISRLSQKDIFRSYAQKNTLPLPDTQNLRFICLTQDLIFWKKLQMPLERSHIQHCQ